MTSTPHPTRAATPPPSALLALLAPSPRGPSRGGLEETLKLGKHVLDWLFDGDLEGFRESSRSGPSLRSLVADLSLGVSPVSLHRAVSLYELSQQLGPLCRWSPLGVTHLRSVFGLPRSVQLELLDSAQRLSWSVRKLEAESSARRHQGAEGRRPPPRFPRTVRRLQRESGAESLSDLEQLKDVDDELLLPTLSAITKLQARLARLEAAIRPGESAAQYRPVCLGAPEFGMERVKIGA